MTTDEVREAVIVLVDDDELALEALAADPEVAIAPDAVPLRSSPEGGEGLLPGWYMPASAGGSSRHSRTRKRIVYVVVAAFLLINAAGLCSTYGPVAMG